MTYIANPAVAFASAPLCESSVATSALVASRAFPVEHAIGGDKKLKQECYKAIVENCGAKNVSSSD